ncbi:MAG: LysE family translocator [Magnetococcales bacterium]|nr:LysE family translocator [Magnetococcales bacterium]
MLPLDQAALFYATSALLALVPGPDNLFLLAQSALHGRKAGLSLTFGFSTGILFHTLLVILGVATLIRTSESAFTVLKLLGALYLLTLAWQSYRDSRRTTDPAPHCPTLSMKSLYRRGILMNASNPKVTLFFLAFLPQFTDPARGSVTGQILLLSLLFILNTIVMFGAIAWGAGALKQWLRERPSAQMVINRVAAVVLATLAIQLLLTSTPSL